MNNLLNNLFSRKNLFLQNVTVVIRGAVVGQIVLILTAPVLTRMYAPVDFGVYQTFTSVLSIGLVISALRYDIAITLPEDSKQASQVLLLSFMILLTLTGVFFAGARVYDLLGDGRFIRNLPRYFVPFLGLCFLFAGSCQILNYWALRQKDFVVSSNGRVAQVVGLTTVALVGGVAMPGAPALLLADIAGRFTGLLWFGKKFLIKLKGLLKGVLVKDLINVARRYKAFPMMSSPSSLVNTAGLTLTPLLLYHYYGLLPAGLFALTERVMGAPSSLIAGSVAQVYLSDASSLRREAPERIQSLFWKIIWGQLKVATLPFLFLFTAGPWIFGLVFGSEWIEAGVYARILIPTYFIGFIAAPINMTLIVLERQGRQLLWDCGRLLMVITCWVAAKSLNFTAREALFAYGVGMSLFYLLHILLCRRALCDIRFAPAQYSENLLQD